MIALWIILGILLFLTLVMLIKIELFAVYKNELSLKLKVLFFSIDLIPQKKNKSKKKKPKKQQDKPKKAEDKKSKKENKPSYLKKLKQQKGVSGIVNILKSIAQIATTTLKGIVGHIVIHYLNVDMTIVGEDAADTALKYGKLCGAVYSAVAVITSETTCRDYTVSVTPDFDDNAKSFINCDMHCHIRVIYIVKYAVYALLRLLWLKLKS